MVLKALASLTASTVWFVIAHFQMVLKEITKLVIACGLVCYSTFSDGAKGKKILQALEFKFIYCKSYLTKLKETIKLF